MEAPMHPDSRRYHRRRRLPLERRFSFGSSGSDPSIQRPFGYLPNNIARQLYRQEFRPMLQELGFGGGQGPLAGLLGQLTGQGGGGAGFDPMGGSMGGGSFLGSLLPGLQQVGTDAATQGSQAFSGLQGQIDQFLNALPGFQTEAGNIFGSLGGQVNQYLQQLPGFQKTAQQGTGAIQQGLGTVGQALGETGQAAGYGGQLAREAFGAGSPTSYAQQFDPQSQNALYQQSGNRLLNMLRPGEAARGLEQQGGAQDAESQALRDLSFSFAQNQQGNQTQAIQNLLGAQAGQGAALSPLLAAAGQTGNLGQAQGALGQGLGTMAGLQSGLAQSGMGPIQQLLGAIPGLVNLQGAGIGPAGQLLGAIPGLESLQTQPFQLPFGGLQNFLGLLGFGTGGAQNLLGTTAPSIANTSGAKNFGLL